MISMTLLTLEPLGFLTSTGISNFLDSSLGAQLVTLGVPSLSVSLCTVILNVLVAIFPVGSLASTVTVNSFVSSFGPQLFTAGVLLILLPVYVTPFGIPETVTVAVGSSVVTVISEIALPSTTV